MYEGKPDIHNNVAIAPLHLYEKHSKTLTVYM